MRLERRIDPPGTSPGTIVVPVRAEVPPRRDPDPLHGNRIEEIEVDRPDVLAAEPSRGSARLDVEATTSAHRELARATSPGARPEDVVNLGPAAKVEEYDGLPLRRRDLVCRKPRAQARYHRADQPRVSRATSWGVKHRPSDVFDRSAAACAAQGRMRSAGSTTWPTHHRRCWSITASRCSELGARIERVRGADGPAAPPELLAERHRVRPTWCRSGGRLAAARDGQPAAARRGRLVQKETRVFLRDVPDPRVDDRRHGRDLREMVAACSSST